MAKISIQDLERIAGKVRKATMLREGAGDAKIIVHMGTCGISAGAREIMTKLVEELDKRDLEGVLLTSTGCAGLCSREPMVTVELKGQAPVKYVDLDPEKISEIFQKHVIDGQVVDAYALGVGNENQGSSKAD